MEQDGGIDENEGELLRNALEFRDLTAAEILTHRIDLEAVDIGESHEEIARAFTPVSYTHLDVSKRQPSIEGLDMDHIATYVRPNTKMRNDWKDVPEDIKETFELSLIHI